MEWMVFLLLVICWIGVVWSVGYFSNGGFLL